MARKIADAIRARGQSPAEVSRQPESETEQDEQNKSNENRRPPSIANRTPRQHARQLLAEQFDGDIPRLRRYLLRMIECLDDLDDEL